MSNHVTITGRLGQDPELRFTQAGKAVANGSVADTPRRLNKDTQQWEDVGETLWLRFSIWDKKAEAFAERARKGDLVTVVGRLKSRSWDQDGQKRTAVEMDASEVSIVPRMDGPAAQPGSKWNSPPQQPAQADPWQAAPTYDEPPF